MPNNDLAFVTGATGFVGSAVVRALLAAGFGVRALARRQSAKANLDGLGVELVEGDMRDPVAVRAGVDGARYVFHVAADYRLWAPDPDEILRANVEGTRVVMEAAATAGVERIVYTSSVATLKPRDDGEPADETRPLTESEAIGAYKRSKVAAERLVEAMVEDGLPAVIVNPSAPIGPRDRRPTPTGRMIVEAASGRIPAFVDTGLNLVHVDDVADGPSLGAEHGRIGERYILGGENMTLAELLGPHRSPDGTDAAAHPPAALADLSHRFRRRGDGARHQARAVRDSGRAAHVRSTSCTSPRPRRSASSAIEPSPAEEGIRDAIDWFRAAGCLS